MVNDAGLPWCDARDWRIEHGLGAAAWVEGKRRRNRRLRRAQLHRDTQLVARFRTGPGAEPVELADADALAASAARGPTTTRCAAGSTRTTKKWLAAADAEAAALTDGEVDDPLMAAEHPAVA